MKGFAASCRHVFILSVLLAVLAVTLFHTGIVLLAIYLILKLLFQSETVFKNKPYDESVAVNDSEEVASQYTPTPRVEIRKGWFICLF